MEECTITPEMCEEAARMVAAVLNDPSDASPSSSDDMDMDALFDRVVKDIEAELQESSSQLVKSRDGVWHTPVSTVQHFLDNPDQFTEEQVQAFRNGVFDESLKGHSIARQSLLIQKAMFIVHRATSIPMSFLTRLTGSMEMYKCQAVVNGKRCDATAVSGFFYCGNHRCRHSHEDGADAMVFKAMMPTQSST